MIPKAQPSPPKMSPVAWVLTLLLAIVGLILGALSAAPMRWLDYAVDRASNGMLRVANTTGQLWQGTGVLAMGLTNPQPVLGPVAIRVRPSFWPMGLRVSVLGSGVTWAQSSDIWLSPSGQWRLPAGEANLLATDFSGFPGLLGLSRVGAQMTIRWPEVSHRSGAIHSDGVVNLRLSNVSSAMVPIKPLADIDASFTISGSAGGHWSARSSDASLLDLAASGNWEDRSLRGSVRCRRYCDYVTSFLAVVGKKSGEEYVFNVGPQKN